MLATLQRLFRLCRHRAMYREHRELHGRPVMHFVCDCGYAVPVVKRTEDEVLQLDRRAPARPGRV
jgi:hypothetical protein